MPNRKRRHRGKWAALKVKFNVELSPGVPRILKKQAVLAVLKGEPVPEGAKIRRIAWDNPDADWHREVIDPGPEFLYDVKKGLPTLNRGGWLEKMLEKELHGEGEVHDNTRLERTRGPKRKGAPKRKRKKAKNQIRSNNRRTSKSVRKPAKANDRGPRLREAHGKKPQGKSRKKRS